MIIIETIGFAAAVCTTIAFLPQFLKVWKSHHTQDISLPTFILFTAGVLLWLIYGIFINSLPVILANTFTFILAGLILIYKLRYH